MGRWQARPSTPPPQRWGPTVLGLGRQEEQGAEHQSGHQGPHGGATSGGVCGPGGRSAVWVRPCPADKVWAGLGQGRPPPLLRSVPLPQRADSGPGVTINPEPGPHTGSAPVAFPSLNSPRVASLQCDPCEKCGAPRPCRDSQSRNPGLPHRQLIRPHPGSQAPGDPRPRRGGARGLDGQGHTPAGRLQTPPLRAAGRCCTPGR